MQVRILSGAQHASVAEWTGTRLLSGNMLGSNPAGRADQIVKTSR